MATGVRGLAAMFETQASPSSSQAAPQGGQGAPFRGRQWSRNTSKMETPAENGSVNGDASTSGSVKEGSVGAVERVKVKTSFVSVKRNGSVDVKGPGDEVKVEKEVEAPPVVAPAVEKKEENRDVKVKEEKIESDITTPVARKLDSMKATLTPVKTETPKKEQTDKVEKKAMATPVKTEKALSPVKTQPKTASPIKTEAKAASPVKTAERSLSPTKTKLMSPKKAPTPLASPVKTEAAKIPSPKKTPMKMTPARAPTVTTSIKKRGTPAALSIPFENGLFTPSDTPLKSPAKSVSSQCSKSPVKDKTPLRNSATPRKPLTPRIAASTTSTPRLTPRLAQSSVLSSTTKPQSSPVVVKTRITPKPRASFPTPADMPLPVPESWSARSSSSLFAPTAASAAKELEPRRSMSTSRPSAHLTRATRGNMLTKQASMSALRAPRPPRASYPGAPAANSRASSVIGTRAGSVYGETFLERMARPTKASLGKVHDKIEIRGIGRISSSTGGASRDVSVSRGRVSSGASSKSGPVRVNGDGSIRTAGDARLADVEDIGELAEERPVKAAMAVVQDDDVD